MLLYDGPLVKRCVDGRSHFLAVFPLTVNYPPPNVFPLAPAGEGRSQGPEKITEAH